MTDIPDEKPRSRRVKPEGQTRSTVYIDDEDWARLRQQALDAAVPINSLVVASIRAFMDMDAKRRDAVITEARRITSARRA